jgi:hypothetical protein
VSKQKRPQRPLTRQTKEALEGIVKQVAEEMGFEDGSYLYKILADNGSASDSYAHFKILFRSVTRVSLSRARIWLDDLNAIFNRETEKQSKESNFQVQSSRALEMLAKANSILADKRIETLTRDEQKAISQAFREASQAAEMAGVLVEDSLKTEEELMTR